jgi:flagellar hook-basal body complex protein FliE
MQNSFSVSPVGPASIGSISPLDTKSTSIAGLGSTKEVQPGEHVQSFGETLANVMGTVNKGMDDAVKANDSLVDGSAESLHSVQIAGVKSEILMKMTTTITSKLAQATTQLFQMQV